MCLSVCMYVCMYEYTTYYIRMHVCVCVCVCLCINLRMYVSYVRMFLCMHEERTCVFAMRAISLIIMNAAKKIRCQRDFL